jgi:hypothetical protein
VFERFSDDATRAVLAAQSAARQLQWAEIETEHLLLGILSVRPEIAELAQEEPGLFLSRARSMAINGSATRIAAYIPYSAYTWRAIEEAARLAKAEGAKTEPEHFLRALLSQHRESGAQRLVEALPIDREAVLQWCAQSLAGARRAPAGDGDGPDGAPSRYDPLDVPSWPLRVLEFYRRPLLWGMAMEGAPRWRRAWFLAACAVSASYAAWAATAYVGGRLPEFNDDYWFIALIIVLMLSFGAVAYWSGKSLGALVEGWRIAGTARGAVIVAGYLLAGVPVLGAASGVAVGAAMVAFGPGRVISGISHPDAVSLSVQTAWLILLPIALSVAIFAAYSPFWHYSVPGPLFSAWRRLARFSSDSDDLDQVLAEFDALLREIRGSRLTSFATELLEQAMSAARATMLTTLYRFSGQEKFLDLALATSRVAADVCLRNPRLARYYAHADTALGGLADALWAIYQVRPDEEALRDAIWARENLAESGQLLLSASNRRENAGQLARLWTALYEQTGDQGELQQARAIARRAAQAGVLDDPSARVLLSLGRAEELFLDTQLDSPAESPSAEPARSALSDAEAAYRAGASQGQEDDAAECRLRLGLLLVRKAAWLEDETARSEGLDQLRELAGPPLTDAPGEADGPPPELRARYMTALAGALAETGAAAEAVAYFKAVAAMVEAPAALRLEAARGWGEHAPDAADAAAGFDRAVELMVLAVSPGLGPAAARQQLSRWAELPMDAAAAQLSAGKPERALELLEHGRTVMWSRRMALREVPLEPGDAADQQLVERLRAIRRELVESSQSVTGFRRPGQQNATAERRAALYREWNRGVDALGAGHPVAFAQLEAAAKDGPVVVLNMSRLRNDALILCPGRPLAHVRLDDDAHARPGRVIEASVELTRAWKLHQGALASPPDPDRASSAERRAFMAAEDQYSLAVWSFSSLMEEMLTGWLWSGVTEPVLRWLDAEGALTRDGVAPSRLWWCPTGRLTFLPLHAAGSSPESVMDRVISSYTPSLGQLIRARAHVPRPGSRVLILAPDSDLKSASEEADLVARLFPEGHERLPGDAGLEACLSELGRAAVVHFVGHGQAPAYQRRRLDPQSAGGLVVGPASAPALVSTRDLAELPQARARFAYLSVCDAAAPDDLIPDEAAHPAAALHFGGFPNVIATLRLIPDESAPGVAADVYTALTRDGRLREELSASALHDALLGLRRDDPDATAPWTTYVHYGP